jgi:hypothetical protein
VPYLIVAEADRDLKQISSRLALTERLAVPLADTPADLLPAVCYLCRLLNACTGGNPGERQPAPQHGWVVRYSAPAGNSPSGPVTHSPLTSPTDRAGAWCPG